MAKRGGVRTESLVRARLSNPSLSNVTVIWFAVKVAVIVLGPFIVAVVDADDVLVTVIDPLVLQDENVYPPVALAEFETPVSRVSYQVGTEGSVVPPAGGVAANCTRY